MSLTQSIVDTASPKFWFALTAAGLGTLACFCLALRFLRLARLMEDTPTAKIRSAPQGYVELEGRAQLLAGEPIHAPLSGAPCIWYSYRIQERKSVFEDGRSRRVWETIESGTSDAIFQLEDDTGRCIVDPEGAEVVPSVSISWRGASPRPYGTVPASVGAAAFALYFSGDVYRYSEKRIAPGHPLYAIGWFAAWEESEINPSIEVGERLRAWKKDKAALFERFDLNGDGEIDVREWDLARARAAQSVEAEKRSRGRETRPHLLKKPRLKQQPFILSAVPQRRLIRRYRRSAGFAASGFFLMGALTVWAVHIRLA